MSRPGSNSHFEGAIILDDDGTSTDNTGPVSYVGFGMDPNSDESIGPRISGLRQGGTPLGGWFAAPVGSLYLSGTGDPTRSVWHNIDGTVNGWVQLLQQGTLPVPSIPPTPSSGAYIIIDLPDTGALLTLDTDFILTWDISGILDTWAYKLDATGIATDTLMPILNGNNLYAAVLPLIGLVGAGIGGRINPRDLLLTATASAGDTLRLTQNKALAAHNNAVRWIATVI